MNVLFLIFGLAVILLEVLVYNRIVKRKFFVKEAYSGIDVQLKKRHELIPNLVEAAKGYMGYERKVLEEVVNLRAKSSSAAQMNEKGSIESGISQGLKSIFALIENYPDLKANTNLLKLHESLVDIEDQLQMARRYYNGAVRDYNTAIETFPGLIVAGIFGFKPADFFEIEFATERRTPEVNISGQIK